MMEIKQDSTQDLLKKAEQLRLGGYYDLARAALDQLIQKNPFFAPAKLALGRVYFESGDLANARSVLEEFAEFVPDHSLANKILAKIYIHFSQFEKAREKINMVLSITPADSIAKKMLLEIEEENRFLEEENLSDEDTKKSTAPTNTATIAEIYWAQGHVKEALEIYKELSIQDSGNVLYQQKIVELENHLSAKFQEAETSELDPLRYQEDAAQSSVEKPQSFDIANFETPQNEIFGDPFEPAEIKVPSSELSNHGVLSEPFGKLLDPEAPTSEILELESKDKSVKKPQQEKLERMLSLIQKNRRA